MKQPPTARSIIRSLFVSPLDWAVLAVPVAVAIRLVPEWNKPTLLFFISAIAVIPLAGWMGRATEHLSHRAGEGVGGLLNATFGNAAELIIALMALSRGLIDVVKASITGSIVGNILLVLGASILAGGARFKRQTFNQTAARVSATTLTLAVIGLLIPTVFHRAADQLGGWSPRAENQLSLVIAVLLFLTYGVSLVFSLVTHRGLFGGPHGGDHASPGPPHPVPDTTSLSASPAAAPAASSVASPAASHDAPPDSLPGAFPDAVPDASRTAFADASPAAVPDASSDARPGTSPAAFPGASPAAFADASSDAVPDASSDAFPYESSVASPSAFPDAAPNVRHGGQWPLWWSLTVLGLATALVAVISEFLVGSIEAARHTLGLTEIFVGVVIVAVIGNAAEHSTAILVARKNKMDLSLGIAVGSSVQIALFVTPVLVFASYLFGTPMDLEFTLPEIVAVALAVWIVQQISGDGESNWMEGVQLLAAYLIIGVLFYYLPEPRHGIPPAHLP